MIKKPLNKFLFKALLFVIPVFLFFEILFRLGFSPIVTNSTLFDLKMLKVQQQHIKKASLLSMGSSINLYELNSNIVVQNIHLSYYNFASWGLQMVDLDPLVKDFVKTYHPKYVVICSSFPEFISPKNNSYLNYINANGFLKNYFPELFYFKNYNSLHQVVRRKLTTYPLNLDNWGGATLRIKQKDIDRQKWNEHDIFPTRYTQANYNALDSISTFLNAQKVKFIFVQAPIKESYTNTPLSKQLIQLHFERCKSIVERRGGIYLNYYNPVVFTDSLFFDQYHLQDTGAVIFTKEVVADLKKIIDN